MKTLCTLLISLFLTHLSVAQDSQTKTHETDQYSIEYPSNWELDTSGQSGTKFFVKSPLADSDKFQENVNLIIQDLSANPMSLEDYTELSMTQLMAAGALVSENEQSADKPTRQKLTFTANQAGFDLRLIQYYWMVDDKAYVLTLTCLQGEEDAYWEAGQKMMDSFKIK